MAPVLRGLISDDIFDLHMPDSVLLFPRCANDFVIQLYIAVEFVFVDAVLEILADLIMSRKERLPIWIWFPSELVVMRCCMLSKSQFQDGY